LLNSLLTAARQVSPYFSHRPVLADEGDELVLEAAFSGQADIVTFNEDDFGPAKRFGVRVIQPREALKEYYDQGDLSHGEK
jgi:hypothetical protein